MAHAWRLLHVSRSVIPDLSKARRDSGRAGQRGAKREVTQTLDCQGTSPVAAMQRVLPLARPSDERRRTRREVISQAGLGSRARDVLASSQRCGVRHRDLKRHGPLAPKCALEIPKAGSKASQVNNHSPWYTEQAPSRGHETTGFKLCPSSKKLRGLGVRAQARSISIFLILCCGGSLFPVPPA